MNSEFSDSRTQEILELLNISFFVALKGTETVYYSEERESTFRQTITAPILLETEHILVYQIG
ncbi:MAG: hypothetical protein ACXABY_05490 [Candidatus Thorarchaeota archaeon]|jgi:hypothetical protein